MGKSLAELNVIIAARTSAFTKGLNKIQRDIDRFARKLDGIGTSLTGVITAPLAGLAAGAIAATNQIGQIQQFANVAGLSAQRLTELSLATERYGVSQEKLSDILKDVNDKVGDFLQTGGGPLKDFFENIAPQVGITADAFKGLNSEQALQLYIDSLEKANVSQAEMTFYLEAIANDATLLAPAFRNGGQAINEMSEQARKLGLSIDEGMIQRASEASRELKTITSIIKINLSAALADLMPLFQTALSAAMPALQSIGNAIRKVSKWLRGLSDEQRESVVKWTAIVAAIGPALIVFSKLVAVGSSLIGTVKLIGAALTALMSPVGLIVTAVAALAAGIVYAAYNWDAIRERITDISWWRNAIIDMAQFWIEYNPFGLIAEAYQKLLKMIGQDVDNPFEQMADSLEQFKVPEKTYTQFKTIGQTAKKIGKDLLKATGLISGGLSPSGATADEPAINAEIISGGGAKSIADRLRSIKPIQLIDPLAIEGIKTAGVELEKFTAKAAEVKPTILEISSVLSDGLGNAAVAFGEGIGQMAAGVGSIGDIGKSLVGVLAGVLEQVGQMAIKTGIAMMAIKKALKFGSPFAAIAAGVALIALSKFVVSKLGSLGGKSYYEGTTRTPRGNADSRGGDMAIVHPDERIVPARLNKLIGFDLSNTELVKAVQAYKDMKGTQFYNGAARVGGMISNAVSYASGMAGLRLQVEAGELRFDGRDFRAAVAVTNHYNDRMK